MNYCAACRTLYFNRRFRADNALALMVRLGVNFGQTGWQICFRSEATMYNIWI